MFVAEDITPSNISNVTCMSPSFFSNITDSHSNMSNVTVIEQQQSEEEGSSNMDKSEKRRGVVSQVFVNKMPIVLKETSVNSVADSEERDEFIVTPLQRKSSKDFLLKNKDENLANFNWSRSDTFDVIPISQSSVIAVPVKPKRGVISPLQTQRYPTERDDTVTSLSRPDVVLHRITSPPRGDHHHQLGIHHKPTESCSEHSTFSQESCCSSSGGEGSSSFDYEVQYITPQLSDPDLYSEEDDRGSGWSEPENRINFSFDGEDFLPEMGSTHTREMMPEGSNNTGDWSEVEDDEDDLLTPQ